MKHLFVGLLAALLMLMSMTTAQAQIPDIPPGEEFGCGETDEPTMCGNCEHDPLGSCGCGTNPKKCRSSEVICLLAAEDFTPCPSPGSGAVIYKHLSAPCWYRRSCVNSNGHDNGNCQNGWCGYSSPNRFFGFRTEFIEAMVSCTCEPL